MARTRVLVEFGMGTSLRREDYTKAARREVQDALHHSSITLLSTLGIDHAEMRVMVTIGVQAPDHMDCDLIAADLPRGRAEVRAVKDGLDVVDTEASTRHIVATAAIDAFLPDFSGQSKLS
ncbi:Lin0512 family protein [Ruegeria sp. MALMAid1280]|uniref:Lin0512 family protein n=1 Tax=Ruegeria sp. MALMAid1280 TaxID=3411634 RepID=UPI003B9E7AE8